MPLDALVHDWNTPEGAARVPVPSAALLDDTLRDGLQSTAVRQPPLAARLELLGAMARAGIGSVNLGLPAVSAEAARLVERLCREAASLGLGVVCAGRTLESDMRAVVEVAERTGLPVEGHAFVGSSALRARVEGWDLEWLRAHTASSIGVLVRAGLRAAFVTEDTTRSDPATLRALFAAALDAGATRLCLCDTVGHATPAGVRRLVAFTRAFLAERGQSVALDWHGHADRGLSLANALAALDAGVDRVHGTALGLGERAGNTPLELFVLNLWLDGRFSRELAPLADYCKRAAELLGAVVPANHPLVGEGAFRTATGVHAAAIRKAERQSNWLSERVYGAVPSSAVGRSQELCIGPLSGRANVEHWLAARGIPANDALVGALLAYARSADHVLSDSEVFAAVKDQHERWR
ncbi:MAG TPA: 2-isopropylmalate synthase [Polyangiaceae bacterium]|nr:2-isopropylmalate synthase [Polyangiaceae bacterium]